MNRIEPRQPPVVALALAPHNLPDLSPLSTAVLSTGRAPYADWYLGRPGGRLTDPARSAYESAIETLKKELALDECQAIWLHGQNSMQDVQDAVGAALKQYETRAKGSKVRAYLSKCSSRVLYYGTVFDVFTQHYPEYVSLAWGTFKFLFIAVMNHEELLVEISKAVTRIADVLPRTELHSILYPTERMQEAVANVYAKILEFSLLAIKWYKKGKVMHSISAIVKPFSLSFKAIIDDIMEQSRRVDELASAASKAEIRDLHVNLHGLNEKIHLMTEMMISHQSLQNQVMLDLKDQKQFFRNAQVENIRNTMLLEDASASEDSLAYCRSVRSRRRQKLATQLPLQELYKLKLWLADPSSSLLLAQGQGVRTSSLDFAVDFLDGVRDVGYPIIWAMTSATAEESRTQSVTGVLRSLVSQALQLDPSIVSEGSAPVTAQHVKGAITIEQWFTLFERCTASFPRLFLVVDTNLIELAVEHEEAQDQFFKASDFVERLSEMTERRGRAGLKVVVISWRFNVTTSLDAGDVFDKRQILTDGGKKIERLMRQPRYRSGIRRRNERVSERFKSAISMIGAEPCN